MLGFLCLSYSWQTDTRALLDLSRCIGISEDIEDAMIDEIQAAILKITILKGYFKLR